MKMHSIDYPAPYESEFIKCIAELVDDLRRILESSGDRVKYSNWSEQRYRYLDEKKEQCVFYTTWFESYGLYKGTTLFGIRFANTRQNLRIVFIFHENKAVLLHGFSKRTNGDVERAKETAYRRLNK